MTLDWTTGAANNSKIVYLTTITNHTDNGHIYYLFFFLVLREKWDEARVFTLFLFCNVVFFLSYSKLIYASLLLFNFFFCVVVLDVLVIMLIF